MKDITISITAASYSGNKGAAAMLQSSIKQLYEKYGNRLNINLMSVYPSADKIQIEHDYVRVVSCKPQSAMFVAFPIAVIYSILKYIPFIKCIISKNEIIKTYLKTDIVIDEAGISFVDSRGFIMNTYAFVTIMIPMLLGVPVVKYSQAMGPFKNIYNRILAKIALPKLKLICARGEITKQNLASIGIIENVKICADGAFSMPDDSYITQRQNKFCSEDLFYSNPFITVSISSVVEKKCRSLSINYTFIMAEFINEITNRGVGVQLIANAARLNTKETRNNDLILCDEIYVRTKNKEMIRWYHDEMCPEMIRDFIGRSKMLVASRFHAMVAGLERVRPVLLIGWSHKYKEVLDMFNLGEYAINYSELTLEHIINTYEEIVEKENYIKNKININIHNVKESSKNNIVYMTEIIDKLPIHKSNCRIDLNNPDRYIGASIGCRIAYASDESIRLNGASGGVVTGFLCSLLRSGEIDGAWVTKTVVENGDIIYKSFIATTEQEICDCSSSIYMSMPLLKQISMLKKFSGKVAVVMLPCQISAIRNMLRKNLELNDKVILLSLFCSGNVKKEATIHSIDKSGYDRDDLVRFIYRRGLWRGKSLLMHKNGTITTIPYIKTIGAYKNAYYYNEDKCMVCQDHFGRNADLSFGDIWIKGLKRNNKKYTNCIIRNRLGEKLYMSSINNGDIIDRHISYADTLRGQLRALTFKYNCAEEKVRNHHSAGRKILLDTNDLCKWNHKLAYRLAVKNQGLSKTKPYIVNKTPMRIIYIKMLFIRVLLSF